MMNVRKALLAVLAASALAACENAPTEPMGAPEAGPRKVMNSAPVAVIHVLHKRPFPATEWRQAYMDWNLDAQGSYDPDGDPLTYRWTSDCVYIANGYSYSWVADANLYETCYIDLYVSDGVNTTNARAKVYNSTITYL